MDLSLLTTAYRGAKDAEKENQDRAYLQQARDYALANLKEQADMRDARMSAERARLADATSAAQASTELRPLETDNRRTQLGLDAGNLKFKTEQQPITQATESVTNQTNLDAAQARQALLPEQIVQSRLQGRLGTYELRSHALGGFAAKLLAGDDSGALAHINYINQNSDLFPESNGASAASIERVDGGTGADGKPTWTARVKDANGNVIANLSREELQHDFLSALGKNDVKDLGPGHKLVGVRGNQAVTLAENAKTDADHNDTLPPEGRMINFYIDKMGYSKEQAVDAVKQAKGLSHADFVGKHLLSNPLYMTASPAEKAAMEQQASELYMRLHNRKGPAAGAPFNPDPAVSALLRSPAR